MSLGLPPPKIKFEDLPGAPRWIEPLLRVVNQLIDYIGRAFAGGATLAQNINGVIKTIEVRTGTSYTSGTLESNVKFETNLGSVSAVFVLSAIDKDFPDDVLSGPMMVNWRASSGLVEVRHVCGLQKSHRYTLMLWCW